jgi:uncharacterized protein (DUF1778 family)
VHFRLLGATAPKTPFSQKKKKIIPLKKIISFKIAEVNMENKNLKRLNLKLADTEKQFIIEKAKQARMSPSKYFLYLAESRPIQVIDGVEGIIIALNKVGNVLNQIAKTAKKQDFLNYALIVTIDKCKKSLNEISEQIAEIMSKLNLPNRRESNQKVVAFEEDFTKIKNKIDTLIQKIHTEG